MPRLRALPEPVSGGDAIEKMLRDNVIVYADGTPRTKHITTNLAIEVDEEAGTAMSRAYFTAMQALPGLALQPIVSGRSTIASSGATDNGVLWTGTSQPTSWAT